MKRIVFILVLCMFVTSFASAIVAPTPIPPVTYNPPSFEEVFPEYALYRNITNISLFVICVLLIAFLYIRKNTSAKKIRIIVAVGIVLSIISTLVGIWGMKSNPVSIQKWEHSRSVPLNYKYDMVY